MKIITSIITFSIFSGSVLIGGSFYKDKNKKLDIDNLVYNNQKNSFVSDLLKTNKDLGEVSSQIEDLSSDLKITQASLNFGQNRISQINAIRNTHLSKEQKLDGDIQKRNQKFSELTNSYLYALAKFQKHQEFEISYGYVNRKIKSLEEKIKEIELKISVNSSNERLKKIYEGKKTDKEKELEEAKRKKSNLERDLGSYLDKRGLVQSFIDKNSADTNKFKSQKNILQNYLSWGSNNKDSIEELLKNSGLQEKQIEEAISSLTTEKQKLYDEQTKLSSVIISV